MRISSTFACHVASLALCQACATETTKADTSSGGRHRSVAPTSAHEPDRPGGQSMTPGGGAGGQFTETGGSAGANPAAQGGLATAQTTDAGAENWEGQSGDGPAATNPNGGNASDCIVTKTARTIRGLPDISYQYTRVRYDAATQIATSEYSSTPDFARLTLLRRAFFDATGHVIASSGSDSYNWRDDYTYDSAGNETRWGRTNTNDLDLTVPAQPPYVTSKESTHNYDELGRLSTSTVVMFNAGSATTTNYTYAHDELGRCALVSVTSAGTQAMSTTEKRTYQADGGFRSETSTVTTSGITTNTTVVVSTQKLDESGRLLSVETDGDTFARHAPDGIPDITHTFSYQPDGTITSEYLNFSNDTSNDEAMLNGKLVPVTRFEYMMSSQCLGVIASLPQLQGNACRFPLPSVANSASPLFY